MSHRVETAETFLEDKCLGYLVKSLANKRVSMPLKDFKQCCFLQIIDLKKG